MNDREKWWERVRDIRAGGMTWWGWWYIHIYQPLRSGRIWHKVNFFKRSFTGLNSEFSFSYTSCLTKAEEPSLPYYLPIAGGRQIGFIPFTRVLVLCEMQSRPGFELVLPCPYIYIYIYKKPTKDPIIRHYLLQQCIWYIYTTLYIQPCLLGL